MPDVLRHPGAVAPFLFRRCRRRPRRPAARRMERWIIDNRALYRKGVFVAVGNAFALISGRRPFAPSWMQGMGWTWAPVSRTDWGAAISDATPFSHFICCGMLYVGRLR